MVLTFFFAQFIGILFIVLGVSLFVHKQMYFEIFTQYREQRSTYYPLGFISLILGTMLVLMHSIWQGGFIQVLVSLISWSIFLKSVAFLTLPVHVLERLTKPFAAKRTYAISALALLVVGVYLFLVGSGGR